MIFGRRSHHAVPLLPGVGAQGKDAHSGVGHHIGRDRGTRRWCSASGCLGPRAPGGTLPPGRPGNRASRALQYGLQLQGGVGLLSVEGTVNLDTGHGLDVHSDGGEPCIIRATSMSWKQPCSRHPQLLRGDLFRGVPYTLAEKGRVVSTGVIQRLSSSHNGTLRGGPQALAKGPPRRRTHTKAVQGTALAVAPASEAVSPRRCRSPHGTGYRSR